MTFPTLLAFYAHANDTPALAAGLAMAAQYDAQLDVLHVLRDAARDTQALALSISPTQLETMHAQQEETQIVEASMLFREFVALAAEQRVATVSGGAHIDSTPVARWLLAEDDPESAFITQSHLHDLTLLTWHKEHRELDLESTLAKSARPLMLVPEGWRSRTLARASILWNHSAGATHAVALSLPILKTMEKVQIITADTGELPVQHGMTLPHYLAAHGIESTHVIFPATNNPSAELYAACEAFGSDLIVMGAFSRKTLREKLRGGVTRTLLEKSSIPLVMAY